jgi:hypothetical protein
MLRRVGLFVLGKGMRTLIPVLATGFVESQIERHRIHFHNRGDSPTTTTMPKSPPFLARVVRMRALEGTRRERALMRLGKGSVLSRGL